MVRTIVLWTAVLSIWVLAPVGVRAENFCFATASTYYEQLYCELKARGKGDGLPPLYEFKRNDAGVQASLLRGPARRLGIEVPAPARDDASRKQRKPTPSLPTEAPKAQAAAVKADPPTDCELEKTRITCGEREYQLQGNQHNRNLAPGALDSSQKMNLPEFRGNPDDDAAVARYLREAYQKYIEQMLAIGLGGVTMSYGKFVFLFDDLQDKGLNFSQRFETMYAYLKKDKANMAVSEQLPTDNSLTFDQCAALTSELFVCSRGGRNYVYQAN